ncbi:hypothetical protein [Nocardia sp. CA-119907]|uniref:hypothetical protein n=1 Tax=Nocardia sp. CA-119907 TaxID=3239973 RepID=UPI003D989923
MSAPHLAAVLVGADDEAEIAESVWAAITPEFLELIGWQSDRQIARFPQDHPILGWRICTVAGCHERVQSRGCVRRASPVGAMLDSRRSPSSNPLSGHAVGAGVVGDVSLAVVNGISGRPRSVCALSTRRNSND